MTLSYDIYNMIYISTYTVCLINLHFYLITGMVLFSFCNTRCLMGGIVAFIPPHGCRPQQPGKTVRTSHGGRCGARSRTGWSAFDIRHNYALITRSDLTDGTQNLAEIDIARKLFGGNTLQTFPPYFYFFFFYLFFVAHF